MRLKKLFFFLLFLMAALLLLLSFTKAQSPPPTIPLILFADDTDTVFNATNEIDVSGWAYEGFVSSYHYIDVAIDFTRLEGNPYSNVFYLEVWINGQCKEVYQDYGALVKELDYIDARRKERHAFLRVDTRGLGGMLEFKIRYDWDAHSLNAGAAFHLTIDKCIVVGR